MRIEEANGEESSVERSKSPIFTDTIKSIQFNDVDVEFNGINVNFNGAKVSFNDCDVCYSTTSTPRYRVIRCG